MHRPLLLISLGALAAAQDVAPPASVVDWVQLLEDGAHALTVRYDVVEYDGMRDSRDDPSRADVFAAGYTRYTAEMTRQTATVHYAHGLAGCTIFASLPLVDVERSGDTDTGGTFEQEASGIGDLQLGISRVWEHDGHDHVVWSLAASLPTGSVDERDGGALVAYPLQPGSGTVDLYPAISWTRVGGECVWGAALRGRLHLGSNDEDWARSNSGVFDAWIGRELGEALTGRLQLRHSSWGDVHGGSPGMSPLLDPLEDDERQGGSRTDILLGLDWIPGDGDTVLGLEFGVPVDEWLDGPQMSTDFVASIGVRFGW